MGGSMNTIWKFQISAWGPTTHVNVPRGARLIRFAMQGAVPTVWAIVDPKAEQVSRTFHIVGTGQSVPDGANYVGSTEDGSFIWHLFEKPET
jgi:hypothetical protein